MDTTMVLFYRQPDMSHILIVCTYSSDIVLSPQVVSVAQKQSADCGIMTRACCVLVICADD